MKHSNYLITAMRQNEPQEQRTADNSPYICQGNKPVN